MSKTQPHSENEWIERKNEAYEQKSSSKRVDQLRISKMTSGSGVHSESITVKAFENSITTDGCFIAREFDQHDISVTTIVEYLSAYNKGMNPTVEDVYYHIEGHCSCSDDYYTFMVNRDEDKITMYECTMMRRDEIKSSDLGINPSTAKFHKHTDCNHGTVCEAIVEDTTMTDENENESNGGTDDSNDGTDENKSDLEKLIDGDVDTIDELYLEDDGDD